ncbi:MAG: hypothetical protein KDD04_02580 [Sinomicrobium sp.]|nr:hypothetical protein [Sinomicrobium sp.]
MLKNKKFGKASWDVFDSTYLQKIYLQNGNVLTGYSKRVGFAEKNDKQAVLINWIIRMHKAGYLDEFYPDAKRRIRSIEYCLNHHPYQRLILCLFYNYYECMDSRWGVENREVIYFLDNFYQAIKRGDIHKVKALYIHKKTRFSDPFDLSQRRFITRKSLNAYCRQMIKSNTFTEEQAKSFYAKYTEKYPFDNH